MRLRPGQSPWGDPEEFRPRDLGPVGEQLWSDITAGWRDFTPFQLIILRNAAHTADLIDRLEELLGAEELIAPDVSSQGVAPVDHAVWGGIQGLAVSASRMASMGRRPWLRALTR